MQLLVRRVVLAVPTVFIVTIVTFFATSVLPGDPALSLLGESGDREAIDAYRKELGLDRPIPVRYAEQLWDWMRGDLGSSAVSGRPVSDALKSRGPATATLAAMAVSVSVVIGLPLGVAAAVWRGSVVDHALRVLAVTFIAVPSFWLGTLVIVFGVIWFGWSPSVEWRGFGSLSYTLIMLAVPAALLGSRLSASLVRMTRAVLLEVLQQDYIRTARAKGLVERNVVTRHAMRNAALPIATLIGVEIASVLGGTVVFETIFNIPGLGSYMLTAVIERDYPVIQSVTLVIALMVVTVNFLTDVTYLRLDPRIRSEI